MYRLISKLAVYKNLGEDCFLVRLADIIRRYDSLKSEGRAAGMEKEEIISDIYSLINRLLDMVAIYDVDGNLWQNYLAYLIISNENPFSIACERAQVEDGTVAGLARSDFKIFKALFDYDFDTLEKELGINCFSIISGYKSMGNSTMPHNRSISDRIRQLSCKIKKAADENDIFDIAAAFYKNNGVGKFGLNKAFRIRRDNGEVKILPITNTLEVRLSDLVGYELQKKKLLENTTAFVEGRRANNVLLYGDSGTGKSTAVKAILNEYGDRGLRMIEIYRHQFEDLFEVISQIKNRNYKFIIFMDDLSFEEFETDYKYLKAIIEGGLEIKPDNILIYATSNRRHIIRETWSDRTDMDSSDEIHRSDTMQEKLSLADRFGITINFPAPSRKEYWKIVAGLAKSQGISWLTEEELLYEADRWELSHGGMTGRSAQQFINYLAGQIK